jgi:glycosyltransferase involved in cell wall biosynthesis
VRILYLHQFFTTREGTGGTRSYEFARHLVGEGHEVTMVTADSSAGSGVPARSRGRRPHRVVDGIDVVEVRGASSDYVRATAQGYARRLAGFGGFAAAATAAAVRLPRPDVVFATSPALTVAVPGLAAARRHRVPLVFEVRDLWPRAPIEMGALRNPAARALARGLEKAAYRGAAHVVALSPGMVEGVVAAGVDPGDVTMIPNAADLDLFSPDVDPGSLRAELGGDGQLVCSYFGTMGEANDLGEVVQAAALLRDRGEGGVTFALQGEGKRRPALEAEVRRLGLQSVRLLPAGDKASAARLAAASDACLTVFKDVPVLATNSPNKLFDTFAAGRAAIVNTDGWQRELVEEHEAGLFARPGDPADLAAQVLRLRDDRDAARRMGVNARRLAEERFDRRMLAGQLLEVLERAAAGG